MLNKNVKLFILGGAIIATSISCKKTETNPAPTPLTTEEAKVSLSTSKYEADSLAAAEAQNSPAIKATGTLSEIGGSSYLPNVSSLRDAGDGASEYTSFFNQLFDLTDVVNKSNSGARIPGKATGTWEFYVVTYSGSSSTYGDFKKTSDVPSNGITIKYPSKYNRNSSSASYTNDAEYTVSNFQTTELSYNYCDYSYNSSTGSYTKTVKAKKDTVPTSFDASLKIAGAEVMKANYSVTYGASKTPTSASYSATIGDFSVTYTAKSTETTMSISSLWKKKDEIIAGMEYEITGSLSSSNSADPCAVKTTSGLGFDKATVKNIRKEVTLGMVVDYKGLLNEVLGGNSTASTPQSAVDIYNKYISITLTKTSTNQKIADVLFVYDASEKELYVLKVKYADGTMELASKAYKGFRGNGLNNLFNGLGNMK